MDLSFLRRVDPPCMNFQFKTIHTKEVKDYPHELKHSVTKLLISRPPNTRSGLPISVAKHINRNRNSKADMWKAATRSKLESDTILSGRTKQEDPAHTRSTNPEKIIDPSKANGSKAVMNGGAAFSSNTQYQKKSKGPLMANGGAVERSTGLEQLEAEASSELIPQACSSLVAEELGELQWAASRSDHAIIQDAHNINNYTRLVQDFYLGEIPTTEGTKEAPPGLGIVEFLKGKNIFITGATGFLAKVLVEKILRVQPDVGHLFLLIKADGMESARRRLREEIMDSKLFEFLKKRHGESYEEFMEGRLTPVVGNIAMDHLGIDRNTMATLRNELDVIVNSAATTTFDERYDHALNLNSKGAQRIVEFGKSCPHLQLLMHVSTAFVNGERKGLVHEQAFKIGCSIANETLEKNKNMKADINVETELNLIEKKRSVALTAVSLPLTPLKDDQKEKFLLKAMKELGMERAKLFGWQDTYVFTKAMGEMLIDSIKDQLPVVIIRPSVVESSFKEPFPGWMEGNRMMDPIIISYGKGQLPGFLVDPKSVLDVVPVDMVANAMLAAMAKHASKPGLEVYQVASSVVNPLVFSELARMSREHFEEHPFLDSAGKPVSPRKAQLFQDMDSFMDAVSDCSDLKGKLQSSSNAKFLQRYNQLSLKVKEQAAYLANLYRPYTFYAGRFDTSKTQQLYADLSSQEKQLFGFNVNEIDWETYIKGIHIPGLRKHVLKGRGSNM